MECTKVHVVMIPRKSCLYCPADTEFVIHHGMFVYRSCADNACIDRARLAVERDAGLKRRGS